MLRDGWAVCRGVRLHYLDSDPDAGPDLVPVLFVPGMLGTAETHAAELAALGRGRSDAPSAGYTFADHVDDIAAAVEHAGLTRCCLSAYSRGVPFAIAYADRHPDRVAGLILGDHPARYPAIPPVWVDRVLAAAGDRVDPRVLRALQQESADIGLWEEAARLTCPVLVLRGGQPDALLSAVEADQYRRSIPHVRVITFEDAGHQLWQPDQDRYIDALRSFVRELDPATR
jgi:pimeloyl-ACP methyl ester carboxylesterase